MFIRVSLSSVIEIFDKCKPTIATATKILNRTVHIQSMRVEVRRLVTARCLSIVLFFFIFLVSFKFFELGASAFFATVVSLITAIQSRYRDDIIIVGNVTFLS